MVQLIPLDQIDTAEARRNESRLGDQYTRMHGTPYVMRRRFLKSPSSLPCSPPPWGSLVAINLTTGARAWDVPLGDPATLRPDLAAVSRPKPLGTLNLGGPIVTAGRTVFIGAGRSPGFRAVCPWKGPHGWPRALPGRGRAPPSPRSCTPATPRVCFWACA